MTAPIRRIYPGFVAVAPALLVALAVLLQSGCARLPSGNIVAAVAPHRPPAVVAGVIAAMRPLGVPAETTRTVLAALGMAGAARARRPGETEFVVAVDGGRIVSIVQHDAAGLHPGQHVALTIGARTRVIRLAAKS